MHSTPPQQGIHGAGPLTGLKVLDFSTTLPGPLASLILAEAGATVVKVERPDGGDPGRLNEPRVGGESLQFAMLNRGKRSLAADLKIPAEHAAVLELAREADVLIEQFRPGVMARLGLDYETLAKINRGLIYCSISGYGQDGPYAQRAGHDLNYLALNGVLSLGGGTHGEPILPPALIADIGGGTYPALLNVLLALFERNATGKGRHLDIAMAEQIFPWISRQLAILVHGGKAPAPGTSSHTGGTPRYGIHRSRDGKYIAVAAIEEKFWDAFCDAIDLPAALRAPAASLDEVKAAISKRLAKRDADHWREVFRRGDFCADVMADLGEAMTDAHFAVRGVFERQLQLGHDQASPALPVPLVKAFAGAESRRAPALGELEFGPDLWARAASKSEPQRDREV